MKGEIPPAQIFYMEKGARMTFRFKATFVAWAPVASNITWWDCDLWHTNES